MYILSTQALNLTKIFSYLNLMSCRWLIDSNILAGGLQRNNAYNVGLI